MCRRGDLYHNPTPVGQTADTLPRPPIQLPHLPREVTIVDLAYQPATVEVPAGATVHFTNTRTSVRTVTAGTPTAVGEAFAEVLNGEGSTVDVVIGTTRRAALLLPGPPPFMRGEIVAV